MVNVKTSNDLYFEGQNTYQIMFNNVKLLYCGKQRCNPGYSFGPCVRDSYLIHIVISGKGILNINGHKKSVEKGGAFLIRPGEESFYCADDNMPWTYVWIGFSGNQVENLLNQMGFSDKNVIQLDNTSVIEEKMNGILDSQEMTVMDELKRQSCFYSVLASLIEFSQEYEEIKDDKIESLYVSKAVELISNNYRKKLKVQDIANQIGINRSYLTNLFKKNMGTSPQNYLIDYRLEKSTELLLETQSSMVDIAMEVGYSDSLAFSKAFKQKYGMSPSQYRKKKI